MANMAAKVVGAYFDAKGVKYEVIDEDGAVLKLGFSMDNRDGIRLIVRFDSDSEGVSVKAYDLAKFQEDKKQKMFEVCNKLNAQYVPTKTANAFVKNFLNHSDLQKHPTFSFLISFLFSSVIINLLYFVF